jgi:transcriptional regulator with XRE-family HTH domain
MPDPVAEKAIQRAVGVRLAEARRRRGLSRAALAAALRILPEQVAAYESGSYPISAARLKLTCAALGIAAGRLLDEA